MIKGSCLCGGITYEYDGEITELAVCHCNMCKRAQGTALVTNAPIDSEKFKVLTGEHLMKDYFSNEHKKRVFCSNCGSPIYSQRVHMPEVIRLRVGTVTEGKIPDIDYEIYCESKADWLTLEGDRTQYPLDKS